MDGAGAALPMVAPFLGAGQPSVFAQGVEQGNARLELEGKLATVDVERDGAVTARRRAWRGGGYALCLRFQRAQRKGEGGGESRRHEIAARPTGTMMALVVVRRACERLGHDTDRAGNLDRI